MVRRKSKRKPPPKRKLIEPLQKYFMCPFCNNPKSCTVTMNKKQKVAVIKCRFCEVEYQTTITYLSDPIDVYNEWIDACDAVN
ncbi:transcription elongation factor 1 homolog [Teleopsis dalmanni]|uniref:transcription elongation factor 1 homolog n=1 Tax=Teleopsis dalmanni TaxID=139649 RepID=UPI0018CE6B15|nr:transcription elongation factor 1 homolog [Teleopsis dalmanni]XP_037927748.1 transcription elongation factor 1 homolog [Teleopsis dalmanni]XP_037927749.1 transcription elongation factor 1 homolog [Teleopsis dalmanni]